MLLANSRLVRAIVLCGSFSLSMQAQLPLPMQALESGTPVERELKGGEAHTFTVKAEAGQFVSIVVDQRGIDVVVTLTAQDGQRLAEIDSPNGTKGPEPVAAIVRTTGDLRIEVRSTEPHAPLGRYEIKIVEQRAPNEQDKTNDLAARIAAAKSDDEIAQLLSTESAIITPELAKTVYLQGVNLVSTTNDHPRMLRAFNVVLKLAEQFDDKKALVGAYSGLGTVYEMLEKYDLSAESHLKTIALMQRSKDRATLAQAYANAGHAYRFGGEYAKGLEYYQTSVRIFEEIDNKTGWASELNDVALSYNVLGNQPAAVEAFQKSLAVLDTFDHKRLKIHTLGMLGHTYSIQGRYANAVEVFRSSLQLAEEIKWTPRVIDAQTSIGRAQYKQGNYNDALESFRKALSLAETSKDQKRYAAALIETGDVFYTQGDHQQASEAYEKGLRITGSINDSFGYSAINRRASMAHVHNRLGEIAAANGYHVFAIGQYEKSLQLLESIPAEGFADGMPALLNNMGKLHVAQGKLPDALASHQKALAFSEKIGIESGIADSLTNIANVLYLQNDLPRSLESATRAVEIAQRTGDREALWTAYAVTAKIYRSLNKPDQSMQAYAEAINVIESLRLNVAGDGARASYFARMQEPFEQYTDLLTGLHQQRPSAGFDVKAFEISERQRARSMLESLNESSVDIREGVDADLLQRASEMRQQLNAKAENQIRLLSSMNARPLQPLRGNEHDERTALLKKEIAALTGEYQKIEAEIRRQSPRFAALTQPKPLTLREIQAEILDRDTLLLEFSLGVDQSHLWAVSHNSINYYKLPGRTEIETAVRRVAALLSDGKLAGDDKAQIEYQQQAVRLSQILIAPATEHIQKRRLLIVADGVLQYLPFSALPVPGSKDGQPLAAANEMISVPSASMLQILRRERANRQAQSRGVAIVADPVFSETDERLATAKMTSTDKSAAPPKADSSRSALQRALTFSLDANTPISIARLPFTRREAESIFANAPQGSSIMALDFEADREALMKRDLTQYRIVHFATHGILHSEHPDLSGVVLSLFNKDGEPVNGFLRLNEIYNLKLNADLVVLSACQTALGKNVRGEGLIGLTRGFMYAGSPRVVASLWKVDDVATAELMKIFYQKMLKEKMRPAAALRAAKVAMWKTKRWNSPYYWAAFQVQGDWR